MMRWDGNVVRMGKLEMRTKIGLGGLKGRDY